MNRNIVASIVIGISLAASSSYAVAPAKKFEVGVGALYLQPTGTNLDYAVLGYPLPVQSPHWHVQAVQPSYTLGFNLNGRYFFQNTDNDLSISWDHLSTNDSDFTQAGASQFAVMVFQAGPSAGQSFNNPSQRANATAKFNYDVVNLDLGRRIDTIAAAYRVFLGLSAAQLKENLSATFQDNASTFSINSTNNSRFNGIGPIVGVDGLYYLPYDIGLFATVSASALIGAIDSSTDYTARSPQLATAGIATNHQSISPRNGSQIVPGLDGKLGINYSHLFANSFIMSVALGYEYATYFNAIAFYNPTVVFGNVNTGTIALSSLGKSVSNYSVNGPVFNLEFKFM